MTSRAFFVPNRPQMTPQLRTRSGGGRLLVISHATEAILCCPSLRQGPIYGDVLGEQFTQVCVLEAGSKESFRNTPGEWTF